eukprot:TRINITY_DN5544_c3_g2_i1.p2 TRINITY_DN5544_c3_g2~~TRINITY_DN5544_c3_g2_i1.p2  ORF type:complete len:133 (-),score=3.16 TRINITY_DN5544_c3_g2_i1:37-435(-)
MVTFPPTARQTAIWIPYTAAREVPHVVTHIPRLEARDRAGVAFLEVGEEVRYAPVLTACRREPLRGTLLPLLTGRDGRGIPPLRHLPRLRVVGRGILPLHPLPQQFTLELFELADKPSHASHVQCVRFEQCF